MDEQRQAAYVGYLSMMNDSVGLMASLLMQQTIGEEWEEFHKNVHATLPEDCVTSLQRVLQYDETKQISKEDAAAADLFVRIGAAIPLGDPKIGCYGITPTLAGFVLCATVCVTDVFRVTPNSYMDRTVLVMHKLRPNDVP